MTDKLHIDTLAVHAGQPVDSDTLSRAVPIYQTTSYIFKDTDHAAGVFSLSQFGNIYTRLMNPTTDVLEKRLAALHGGSGAVAAASGMAAIFNAVMTITSQGQNFVTSSCLYGGTNTLFTHTLKRFGIEARFVDSSNPENFEKVIDGKTRFIYLESVGNPKSNVDDFVKIAEIAHKHKIPLLVDNTFTPPPIFNPFAHGADIVIYSLTKMIGGHGVSIGGAVVEKGDFDWKGSGKFPELTEPDPSYHGVNFWDAFGDHPKAAARGLAFVLKIRTGILRDVGACLSPFNSWTFIQGLETLPLRAKKHCENARIVAEFLAKHPKVAWVEYAGLASHPDYERAKKYMPLGPGAVFVFGARGGYEAGKKVINSVKLISHLANVLDAKSLIIHPASTTHQQLTEEENASAGVRPELIRLSVGIEDPADIIADLEQALAKA